MDDRVDALREDIVLFNRAIRANVAGHLLTPTQLQTLGNLDRIGAMSARELATVERVTPQTVARTVTLLEERGLVTRIQDPDDGRAQIISITHEGKAKLGADRRKRDEWLANALDTHCSAVERDVLFAAGALLRRLSSAPVVSDSVEDRAVRK
ncbi:MarR family transcriptional regulator [Rhodococcus sp. 15-725-2-2b]|uniref:MarR family winged helix-turn-helix transcriptional regulator n=1 Tax=unclassified Rhodococcus (in: high G+C Gram-positive bacteria) TaxID=192944 RepID=UPI000B9B3CA8|nr:MULTISPECIES: MarR family transcriptional regulator [unclassified Rhodococcus (in: high G+C Gram-positive bacteria)]OZC61925.1 MarR family transcriptional regulator [Rhodococcus sp. 06-470-2]OZC64578.1 MarR family transcriptional regulator [Rhodococcus sp. 06-469-3-2]OZD51212.1 MarR family transcriptional regulator [Rhodococcus sp. 06-1477-1A]OZE58054.1 MarR family transcriptional regulator [Rhodococcus sp. 05-2221-1B]OZE71651.1 MarR family transcriptional regulator [Rhodococcus sp. 15-725-